MCLPPKKRLQSGQKRPSSSTFFVFFLKKCSDIPVFYGNSTLGGGPTPSPSQLDGPPPSPGVLKETVCNATLCAIWFLDGRRCLPVPRWPRRGAGPASVVGFSVISEERSRGQELPPERPPKQWPWKENPSDIYFNYYIWANVVCALG